MRYFSVCSGIEAATVAWKPLGWDCAGVSEIEPFPSAVLAHHYPEVKNFGDMTKLLERQDFNDTTFDVLVGGTPCQSFSVAGLRKGLADPRGNLALVFLKLLDAKRPRWVVWENVPGVLSSWSDVEVGGPSAAVARDLADAREDGARIAAEIYPAGRDRDRCRGALERALGLGAFEEALQSADFDTFTSGLRELGYSLTYRVLDAQYLGVPQRRRRIFVVGYLGDWRPAAEVLLEPHGLSEDSPPSREAGKRIAAPLSQGASKGGGPRVDADTADNLIAGTVSAKWAKGTGGPSGDEAHNLTVAHTLRAEHDASEDGTGRGTPIIIDRAGFNQGENARFDPEIKESETAPPHVAKGPSAVLPAPAEPLAFSAQDSGQDLGAVSPTVRKGGDGGGVQPAVVFEARHFTRDNKTGGAPSEISPPLKSETKKGDSEPIVMVPHHDEHEGRGCSFKEDKAVPTLRGPNGTDNAIVISIMPQNSGKDYKAREVGVAQPLMAAGPGTGAQGGDVVLQPEAPVVFENHAQDSRIKECEISPQINAKAGTGGNNLPLALSPAPAPAPVRKSKRAHSDKDDETWVEDETANTLTPFDQGDKRATQLAVGPEAVAFQERGRPGGRAAEEQVGVAYSLTAPDGGGRRQEMNCLDPQDAVRRLTPLECERLQGFPDNYTLIPWDSQARDQQDHAETVRYLVECHGLSPADAEALADTPDGPRYKALGNSMNTDTMAWIGKRIDAVDRALRSAK